MNFQMPGQGPPLIRQNVNCLLARKLILKSGIKKDNTTFSLLVVTNMDGQESILGGRKNQRKQCI